MSASAFQLRLFERHLLAVVAEDGDYEPPLTIEAFMSVRFGVRAYPKAVFAALKALHSLGLVSVHKYVGTASTGAYAKRSMPRWSRGWQQQNLWFLVTRLGKKVLEQHASSET